MDVDETVRRIRDIEIQGATAVAEAGVRLLQDLHADGASDDRLRAVADRLRDARPTEPFLDNAVDVVLETAEYDRVLEHISASHEDVAAAAGTRVADGATVYTHCHSSTVVAALGAVADRGVTAQVTETRPLYQGRTTAAELAERGVPVSLHVDAGARFALREADAMWIGADAVAADGTVMNKIGSGMFAAVADRQDVPVYVLTNSWKLDECVDGDALDPEQRDGDEVWADAPDGVAVANYAFEPVDPAHVDGIVSELGVHDPDRFAAAVADAYPSVFDGGKR